MGPRPSREAYRLPSAGWEDLTYPPIAPTIDKAKSSYLIRRTSILIVNATSNLPARRIPDLFLGVFLEEINHGVSGGLWAELVSNRGFEAGNATSNIHPWSIIGDNSSIYVSTDLTSCFERNKVALQMQVLCGDTKPCPSSGVGISNPGFWGMNIEKEKKYEIIFHAKALAISNLEISFTGAGDVKLASTSVTVGKTTNWTQFVNTLEAKETYHNASLQITTTTKGVYWLDQVSAMPVETHKGHGFRNELFQMVAELKPKFLRFPGGTFVEGIKLSNAVKWKDTVGPWEERPGHLNDIWKYWTDDGFGYFEGLQLAEDLDALPIWVFNAGISLKEQVNSSDLSPYVQDALDGIEFARGSSSSKWGSVRAAMGHPKPFDLRYVAIGNEDCERKNYPGMPAFVSEYAVRKKDAGMGSLLAAVAEAAFLIGLEKNSDIVEMVCYAPLFLNINDKRWIPDAIVFDSYQHYGTPSYWVQKFFTESSGAVFLPTTLKTDSPNSLIASAINLKGSKDNNNYIRIKVVNFGITPQNLKISINGLISSVKQLGSTKTVLTSSNLMDENSFLEPMKVVPRQSSLENAAAEMNVILPPYSVTSVDLLT
ncbi:unnamed protein product [Lupinus luteus]|uniref:non-reducing end alpha-L-arabinofuranosidase n=1 Tax=Lupinus luteus TaxID=3873 RepID=A0AAV1XNI2_LUPLU